MKKRIGVYICHCGTNIGEMVDVAKIAAEIESENEEVAVARHYKYMCSEPGQRMIQEDIGDLGLDHVVEASCSPKMHEPTFRTAVSQAGMNPYMFEMVNIREHCSWVTKDRDAATRKAKDLINGAIARVRHHVPLEGSRKPVNPVAMVVGGGIAGITAALKIAKAGYKVYLVEQSDIIGGRMAQFDKTFPTLDCASCTLTPKTSEVGRHPNIEILTKSEVMELGGFVGNFKAKVRQKPRYVDQQKCTGCGDCLKVCPVDISSEFELGLATCHPIGRPFPQAIPNTYSITRSGDPPCMCACPAHISVQGYVALAAKGRFEEALKLIKEQNPLPGICGRICTHPCEGECSRGKFDEPVSIISIKRFLADLDLNSETRFVPEIKEKRSEKVAIVGSGPAGLSCAYYLAIEGYQVNVFEKLPVLGGMLAVGIPPYRLPKNIIEAEIQVIRDMGVEFKTGVEIGKDITIGELRSQGYNAFFMGIGAQESRELGIPGEELEGVIPGVQYLRAVNLGEKPPLGDRIAVIGGGNVAIDNARVARRFGPSKVIMICLETREEMPASIWEIEEAEEEGIEILNSWGPKAILGKDGKVTGIEFKHCTSVFDDQRRFRPTYDESVTMSLEVDTVILAIGQKTDWCCLTEECACQLTPWGTMIVDPLTLQTGDPDIFAGGDARTGPKTAVEAIASGKQAAISMGRFIRGEDLSAGRDREWQAVKQVSTEGRERIPRAPMPTLAPEIRVNNFDEIQLGYTEEQILGEAARCLSCGLCSQCGECVRSCGPQAVDLSERERILELDVGAVVVATGIDIFHGTRYPEYGLGRYPDVVTNLQFERLCNSSGPTAGKVVRISDGKLPQSVVFVQCVGSRDRAKGNDYCSKVCCMVTAKQLSLFKHHNPDGQAYVFYIDNRAGGKGYEEFLRRAIEEAGARYIRGRVAKIFQEGGRVVVRGEDSLLGTPVEVETDLVVLATGLVARKDASSVARALNISMDKYGFFIESHPKLAPVETALSGIYLAGAAQGPKDISESVAQGAAAAAEALALFGMGQVEVDPTVSFVNEQLCTGCKTCCELCAYNAVSFNEQSKVAEVNQALCQGCGTCAAACPMAAIRVRHYTPDQIFSQIEGILA